MASKSESIARKKWIAILKLKYGILHDHSSYVDVANSIRFFTNQMYEKEFDKITAKRFVEMTSQEYRFSNIVFTAQ